MPTRVILSLLRPEAAARLASAAPRNARVCETTVARLAADLSSAIGGVVVLDPDGWHGEALARVADTVERSGARLIVYTPLSANLSRQLLSLGEHTVPEVVLQHVDDTVRHVRAAIERQLASASATLLHRIRGPFGLLDRRAVIPTISLFAWGREPLSVPALRREIGVSGKTLLQWYRRAGLSTVYAAVRASRTVKAFDLIAEGTELGVARDAAGFSSTRQFCDAFNELLGSPPSQAPRRLSLADAALRIEVSLRP